MDPEKIQRINALAKKAKENGLSPAEQAEQAALRAEYLAAVKRNFTDILDHTYVQREDGSKAKLVKVSEQLPPYSSQEKPAFTPMDILFRKKS